MTVTLEHPKEEKEYNATLSIDEKVVAHFVVVAPDVEAAKHTAVSFLATVYGKMPEEWKL